ncbi:putative restriction endonuclease BglII [Brochothrix thermosphacta]|uniref:BglII/BstYI family type II restriction endonuclease n=1 Tax=Brochothrix thermosphacta TaxID=2756 RepID=UPI000D7B84DB|nr:BglII/BstYI family type II restriction endonuclease [Brochothrix thermosphacta]ANZ97822.1 hypothetical protein BFC20_09015 [Brochothrix thermosphacta]SPP25943.1 putative restriction endonuclease BglII [Brochothrix thermosphacta]
MNYKLHSHRYALSILTTDSQFIETWNEILHIVSSISDEVIINAFELSNSENRKQKSLSITLNALLKEEFEKWGWQSESPIFQISEYQGENWRLDFAKDNISIEVAFNHSGTIAWNLLKPVLASELNHVQKAIQTKIGIIICVTNAMKKAGGFDNAIGSFEKFIDYLKPLNNQLSVPLVILGLDAPSDYKVEHYKVDGTNKGRIIYY